MSMELNDYAKVLNNLMHVLVEKTFHTGDMCDNMLILMNYDGLVTTNIEPEEIFTNKWLMRNIFKNNLELESFYTYMDYARQYVYECRFQNPKEWIHQLVRTILALLTTQYVLVKLNDRFEETDENKDFTYISLRSILPALDKNRRPIWYAVDLYWRKEKDENVRRGMIDDLHMYACLAKEKIH